VSRQGNLLVWGWQLCASRLEEGGGWRGQVRGSGPESGAPCVKPPGSIPDAILGESRLLNSERILSADSHIWEPPDLWERRIDRRFRDRAPRLLRADDGDRFVCEGAVLTPFGIGHRRGTDGRLQPIRPVRPPRYEEHVPPAGYDPIVRLKDLEADGVAGEVLYPTVTLEMFAAPDRALRHAIFRAYNDWLAEFVSARRDRYKAIGIVDTDDVGAAVAELERIARMGMAGALISPRPGDNRFVRPEFDRFWAAARALGLPVSFHSGSDMKPVPFIEKSVGMLAMMSSDVQVALIDLVYGGVFARHPELIVLAVEYGAGWFPYMLQAMDVRVFLDESRKLRFGKEEPRRPSDYIRSNVRITFMSDKLAMQLRESLGPGALHWASDFPHAEGTFPHSRAVIDRQLAGVPGTERAELLWGNTAKLYGFA
jgi:predicted TIM-barrel fold metal-dependent hydrolase